MSSENRSCINWLHQFPIQWSNQESLKFQIILLCIICLESFMNVNKKSKEERIFIIFRTFYGERLSSKCMLHFLNPMLLGKDRVFPWCKYWPRTLLATIRHHSLSCKIGRSLCSNKKKCVLKNSYYFGEKRIKVPPACTNPMAEQSLASKWTCLKNLADIRCHPKPGLKIHIGHPHMWVDKIR